MPEDPSHIARLRSLTKTGTSSTTMVAEHLLEVAANDAESAEPGHLATEAREISSVAAIVAEEMQPTNPHTGAFLTRSEVKSMLDALRVLNTPAARRMTDLLIEKSSAHAPDEERKRMDAFMAATPSYVRDGEVEIDEESCVSEGEGNGAYVLGWIWVSTECAGLPSKLPEELDD